MSGYAAPSRHQEARRCAAHAVAQGSRHVRQQRARVVCRYRLQPIHVDDFARFAVEHGAGRDNVVIDATGPETFTYEGLARMLGECIGKPRPIMHVPNWFGFAVGRLLGALLQDTMLTWEEVLGLTADLLATDAPPAGRIRLSEWAHEHADELGVRYASELARRRDRSAGYVPAAA